MERIGVLGAGTWGMALARVLANAGHEVTVWSALEKEVEDFSANRVHPNLPGMVIPDAITFTKDIRTVCENKDALLFAVPSVFVRATAKKAAPYINDGQIIIDVAKGIESDTLFTMSQIIEEEIKNPSVKLVALSGPTHAEEVAHDMPTTIVAACRDMAVAAWVQDLFEGTCMRVYTNDDILGVELCGAMKNVMALAAGISSGLGYGDNAKAAIITRGVAEIARLGMAFGCKEQTFGGLTGVSDLIVTATSVHSRNNRCGMLLGQGVPAEEAIRQVGMVVEGVNALPAAMRMKEKYGVEMPLAEAVNAIVNEGADPKQLVRSLMHRERKPEVPVSQPDEFIVEKKEGRKQMKRVITYGTYDLLHYGHLNLLRRAKALGDYLVVALSTDEFNWNEKQKKCYFSYEQRKEMLEALRCVDLVIPEENWEQKRTDIHEYHIDTFVIGDDWKGKFDFLEEEGAEVVYLPRTPEISTTQIKKDLHK